MILNVKINQVLTGICLTLSISQIGWAQSRCHVMTTSQTLGDVMQDLQTHLNAASEVLYDGKLARKAEPDLQAAIDHIEQAERGVELAIENGDSTMAPAKSANLAPEEKQKYLDSYIGGMRAFGRLLQRYRVLFEQLQVSPPALRNYSEISDLRMTLESFANRAHHEFSG